MPAILLSTLNARYFHASLGLRYLLANLGELQADAAIREFIITQRPLDIAEALLAEQPRIVGFGVYIWNVVETAQVVALLKQVRPDLVVVLGGPEVSHEWDRQAIVELADYLIAGPGDWAFAQLCQRIHAGNPPTEKVIAADPPPLDRLLSPYRFYTDEDIAHRLIYVEASRGCPFKCEFCLSALDKTAWPFPLEPFLAELQMLHQRGVRHFKFVDRTFNLNVKTCARILDFFLERLDERLFLHFELIPDHLPEPLKTRLVRFPPGSLQFEIGVQTFNPTVQTLISRKQDNCKTVDNLVWLRRNTHAYLHADLIAGLPGEDLASFAVSFDRLAALDPHEIQVGVLKRLRGAPLDRHTAPFDCRYNPHPLQPVVLGHPGFFDDATAGALCPLLGFDRQFRAVPKNPPPTAGRSAVRALYDLKRLAVRHHRPNSSIRAGTAVRSTVSGTGRDTECRRAGRACGTGDGLSSERRQRLPGVPATGATVSQ